MSCSNPTLLLENNRNITCNARVAQAIPKTTRIVGLSKGNLYRKTSVSFLTMIQTSLAKHGLHRAHCVKRNHENLLLEDYQNPVCNSLGSSKSSEDHQRSLESYLNKDESENEQPSENISQLKSIESYLGSLTEDEKTNDKSQPASPTDTIGVPDNRTKTFVSSRRKRNENLPNESKVSNDDSSDLYLVSVLVSIDIAVFLFEVASPIKNSDYNLYSLPLVYGAKVNDLILVGEWWRLVTPMFLHSGVIHVALTSWALLDFGPRVCKVYGSFTFFFMCLLGGISGNLASFLHTPEATVGGSGPVFAIIGAWLIYQLQNKDMIPKDVSEKMFQKATIATALSFGLVNFGLIDSWTYLGAALTGITYGFLTCPILQMDDPLSKATREEGITLVGQTANPCKSLGVFVLFVLAFSSLLYMIDPPLDTPQLEDLLEIVE